MPSYKLIYLNLRGLAEPIRLLFKYAEIKFEDVRISVEEWPQHKDSKLLIQENFFLIDKS